MKISVIIAARNAGATIQDCLDSVARQSCSPHEVILVNDGSSDSTVERATATGIPTQLLTVNLQNAAASRNAGILRATGQWIAFLDADDTWYPHHLEHATHLLDSTPHVAYIAAADYSVPNGSLLGVNPCPDSRAPVFTFDHMQYFDWFTVHSWFCNCTVLLRRDRVEEVHGFDENLPRRHDLDLFLRALHNQTGVYSTRRAAHIRLGVPGSISSHKVHCDYYLLKSLVGLRNLYGGRNYRRLIRSRSCAALNSALTYGDSHDFQDVWKLAGRHIGWGRRVAYSWFHRFPQMHKIARVLLEHKKD